MLWPPFSKEVSDENFEIHFELNFGLLLFFAGYGLVYAEDSAGNRGDKRCFQEVYGGRSLSGE
ncbi:hypothetical protein TDIS_1234 [Thermosulfurimonas dismutans]|uniref:Uncharacterized protein n=1 Tax=Thermosulfurimonas dismutans TaxID=999894 RepID=A0A179D4G9_9BACT|nr:hypothetical protein TDIS_1234 [Thermosulfurimonas dismutans]